MVHGLWRGEIIFGSRRFFDRIFIKRGWGIIEAPPPAPHVRGRFRIFRNRFMRRNNKHMAFRVAENPAGTARRGRASDPIFLLLLPLQRGHWRKPTLQAAFKTRVMTTAAIQVPMFHLGMPRQLPLKRKYFRFGQRTMTRLTWPLTPLVSLPTDGYTSQTWDCVGAYVARQYSPYFSIGSSSSISRPRRWNLHFTIHIAAVIPVFSRPN